MHLGTVIVNWVRPVFSPVQAHCWTIKPLKMVLFPVQTVILALLYVGTQKLIWSTCGLKWAADSANTEQWQCCCLSSSYICGHVACDWLAACSTHDLQTFYSVLIEPDSKFIGSRTWREEPRTQTILHQRWTRHQRELSILLLHCAQIPLCVLVPQIPSILCPPYDCTACWKDYTDKTVEKAKTC